MATTPGASSRGWGPSSTISASGCDASSRRWIHRRLPKIYTWELVELLFKQPYCRIANVVDAGLAKRQTASVYLKALADIGVLKELNAGRESLFVHPKYIELLTGDENVWVYYAGVETDTALDVEVS